MRTKKGQIAIVCIECLGGKQSFSAYICLVKQTLSGVRRTERVSATAYLMHARREIGEKADLVSCQPSSPCTFSNKDRCSAFPPEFLRELGNPVPCSVEFQLADLAVRLELCHAARDGRQTALLFS